jgi:hypothetical protein
VDRDRVTAAGTVAIVPSRESTRRPAESYDKIATFRDHYRLTLHDQPRSTSGCCSGWRSRSTALQSR